MIRIYPTSLWIGAITLSLAGVVSSRWAVRDRLPAEARPPSPPVHGAVSAVAAPEPVDSIWFVAPFQASRTLPPERYTPEAAAAAEAEAAAAAAAKENDRRAAQEAAELQANKPEWKLTGVLVGSSNVALFDGPTGPEGSVGVLGVGDEVDGFTVSVIEADSVVVTKDEASWTYTLTTPWN